MPENRRPRRNPVARSPVLRQGAPHQRTRSGERQGQRQALEAELESWWEEDDEMEAQTEASAPKGADPVPAATPDLQFF